MGSLTVKQLGLFQMREDIFDFPKCGFCYTYPFYSYLALITISESVVFVILIAVWYAKCKRRTPQYRAFSRHSEHRKKHKMLILSFLWTNWDKSG
jgi:hypothetical protein